MRASAIGERADGSGFASFQTSQRPWDIARNRLSAKRFARSSAKHRDTRAGHNGPKGEIKRKCCLTGTGDQVLLVSFGPAHDRVRAVRGGVDGADVDAVLATNIVMLRWRIIERPSTAIVRMRGRGRRFMLLCWCMGYQVVAPASAGGSGRLVAHSHRAPACRHARARSPS